MNKVHCSVDNGYGADKDIVCRTKVDDPKSTSIDKNITCKKMSKIIEN
jgi:hypothetical protein